ncbi:MAG: type II toxin-antitoxin system HicB family antitoxin [Acidobacteria bacterium]|nr:type II toxin-antitoxin system HicB family antitoxin [Acidobacteriota bacterium]
MQFVYPAALTRTGPRELVVSFRDLPECLTSGEDVDAALAAAADALAEALAARIDDDEPIPEPARTVSGEHEIAVPPGIAAKAALAIAFRKSGLTRVAFAASLGVDEKVVRRMLDPRHGTSPDRIAKALGTLGQRVAIDVRAA